MKKRRIKEVNLIRIHRQLQNLTQCDLGQKAGLDQSVISKIEKGFIKVSSERRVRIALALGLKESILFPNNEK